MKKRPVVDSKKCAACGCCMKACPKTAISVHRGQYAVIDYDRCVGCGTCIRECPASVIAGEVNAR